MSNDRDQTARIGGSGRSGKALFQATKPFGVESPGRTWWYVLSTLAAIVVALAMAVISPWVPVRLTASVLGGLLLVRGFILYHDFIHKALLRNSRWGKVMFYPVGMLMLTPPTYWRHSHNFHHGNVGKPLEPKTAIDAGIVGATMAGAGMGTDEPEGHAEARGAELLLISDLGSFPLMSTEAWQRATFPQRLRYRVKRHWATIALAYVTVFFFSLSLLPTLRNPRRYWDGAIAIVLHLGVLAGLWLLGGFWAMFFGLMLPFAIASAMGAYLFYAQHNYEGMRILLPDHWSYYLGATESSSYMRLGKVMQWFTGNIGYHHIHHLNPLIPFYRLPEAMAAIPELQDAVATSLRPRDIVACLRLNLWDREHERLVRYREARA
ncbi:MAG: fatty acid desaturase [Phycisphaera sp.]|nr:MAG: fatty acid desaturase [Phycisphaera sp.]